MRKLRLFWARGVFWLDSTRHHSPLIQRSCWKCTLDFCVFVQPPWLLWWHHFSSCQPRVEAMQVYSSVKKGVCYIHYRYHLYAKHAKVSQVKALPHWISFSIWNRLHAETVCVPARGRFLETPELQLCWISKPKQLLKAPDLESRQHGKTVLFRPPIDHHTKKQQRGIEIFPKNKKLFQCHQRDWDFLCTEQQVWVWFLTAACCCEASSGDQQIVWLEQSGVTSTSLHPSSCLHGTLC